MRPRERFSGTPPLSIALVQVAFWLAVVRAYLLWPNPLLLVGAAVVLVPVALVQWWRGWVTLGDGGVTVRTSLFARFVGFEEIERAWRRTEVTKVKSHRRLEPSFVATAYVQLELRSGERVRVPARDPVALATQIAERKRQFTTTKSTPMPRGLAREGRSVGDWIEALRDLTLERAGYREVSISTDALWNIVESRWQREDSRAAAAVALGGRASPETRGRLLRLAASVESKKLRTVIEAAAEDGDPKVLAEVLEAVSADG